MFLTWLDNVEKASFESKSKLEDSESSESEFNISL